MPGEQDQEAHGSQARFYGLLGLVRRAGLLAAGHEAVDKLIESGKGGLLILAGDASPRTRERFTRKARQASLPLLVVGSMANLGRAVGLSPRAVLAVARGPLTLELRRAGLAIGGVLHEQKYSRVRTGKGTGRRKSPRP